jgi:predicted nuclease of predicted toxin-antitoxin system
VAVLKFLADESCDFAVVRAMRSVGHEVSAVSEVTSRSVDRDLIEQSAREDRILLTEDKDFGWLVYVSEAESAGVILIRYPGHARQSLPQAVITLVKNQGEQLIGAFTVLEPGYIRIRRKNN